MWSLIQFSSRWYVYVFRKAHHIIMRSTPSLRSFPNVAFETVPVFVWLMMFLSHPFKKIILHFLLPCLDVLGFPFVPTGSVMGSSTLQIFREASHLWGLLCLPVCLLGHFPSLWHIQGSTATEVCFYSLFFFFFFFFFSSSTRYFVSDVFLLQTRNASLASAVHYSRRFYTLQDLGGDESDKGGYIHSLIVERIRAGVYPASFLPMFRWVFFATAYMAF